MRFPWFRIGRAPRAALSSRRKRLVLPLFWGGLAIGFLYTDGVSPYVSKVGENIRSVKVYALKVWGDGCDALRLTLFPQRDLLRQREEHIVALQAEIDRLRCLSEENTLLCKLLELRAPTGFVKLGARVLQGPTGQRQTLLLDVGKDKGVPLHAAVVSAKGLVGRILEVGPHWSLVLCLTDRASRIPVTLDPSGSRAILVGNSSPTLDVEILEESPINGVPQKVITAGIDGIFPKGLFVGEIPSTELSSLLLHPKAKPQTIDIVCLFIPQTISQEENTSS